MNSLVGTRFGKVVVLREAERVNYKHGKSYTHITGAKANV